MKQKLYSLSIIFTIIILIISIFYNSSNLSNIVNFSVKLFINNIFPSLFPMFIISSLLVEIDIPKVLGNIFKKPMQLFFKTKGEGAFIFFMSMITGFPSSAKYIDDLMEKKMLNKKDAEKLLMFTFFSNPLFIVNTAGNSFFKSSYFGYLFLICHILGNLLIGFIFRNYNQNIFINDKLFLKSNLSYLNNKINSTNILKVLLTSIKNSLEILLNIFGIITFILIIINLVSSNNFNIFNVMGVGLTEMTTGLKYLSLSDYNLSLKLCLAMFFLSFGGFSVHLQIMSILNKRKVRYLPFLIARILHGIFSTVFLIIFLEMDKLF